ncbi:MAG: helix-turn-helix domain-containing protein [Deltaproteobacteria bacterium]|nr:helix-turn-helix domain-containing protein [Deltaproteobacteria bacterium]
MVIRSQHLSVMEIAEICGVARSTVSYWISKKSLRAHRSGKKHLVSVDDLVPFLTSERESVPQALLEQVGVVYPQPFSVFKRCWEY